MKYLYMVVLILLASVGSAVDYYPGSSQTVTPESGREYNFSYHTGSDDYHFYGSGIWAVRFDFHAVYPSLPLCEFAVSKALLYFPQLGDSVKVELFSDSHGLPGTRLTMVSAPVQTNYLELTFPQTVQNDSLWMLVTYATNGNNRFVSASAGGGTHSYFWNTNATNPYFQSLASAGYSAELLFGVGGEFVLSSPDLELMDFDLNGSVKPNEVVYPTFKIYNHTATPITDAVVNMNLYSPDPGFSLFDEITINETIPPGSLYEYNEQSSGYASHQIALPEQPLQLKLRAALTSGLQDDPQANNVLIIHRFSFIEAYPAYLVENFLRYNQAASILSLQDQLSPPQIHALNYFPILSDTLSNVGSQLRFNWYGFNSLPRGVVNGEFKINGYTSSYANQYTHYCDQSLELRTFISESECRLNYMALNDILTGTITLTNAQTQLYASATEYNLLGQSRLHVGLFRKADFAGATRYALSRWIMHDALLDGTLGMGESASITFSIAMNNLTLADLAQNYKLYYWLQLADGGRILYSDWSDFTTVVANQDDLLPTPMLQISHNPLGSGQTMKISLSNNQLFTGLQVFNIKGQRVASYPHKQTEYLLPVEHFPASGIYFLRAKYTGSDGRKRIEVKKIIVVK